MIEFLRLILHIMASFFMPRTKLVAEILILRQQLNVLRRQVSKRPQLSNTDRNRPSTPSGERETRRTHWKSPPLVGIFGASPHVGRKRECVVGLEGFEPPTNSL